MFKVPTRKLRPVRSPLFAHYYEEERRLRKTRELHRLIRAGESHRERGSEDEAESR